ncbi:MAG: RhaT, partial [bacterium]
MSILPTTKTSFLNRFKYDLVLVGVTFIWGSTFFMAKEVVGQTPPINYLSSRFLIASLLLIAISYKQKLDLNSIKGGIVLGLMLYGGFLFQALGLVYTSASKSGFVTGVTVIIVPFFSYFISRSKIIGEHTLAIFIATIGFAFITLPEKNEPVNIGDILTLIGTIFWAFHIVFTGTWVQLAPSRGLMLTQIVTATILFNLSKVIFPILATSSPTLAKLAILANASWPFDSFRVVLQLFYLGTIATILTIFAQTFAQRYVTATRAAIIFSLEPAFASFMAYIFAGERLGWRAVIGGVLIIGAIIIS